MSVTNKRALLENYIKETNYMIECKYRELDQLQTSCKIAEDKLEKIKYELQEKNSVLNTGRQKNDHLEREKQQSSEKLRGIKRRIAAIQLDLNRGQKKKKNLEQLLEQEKIRMADLEQLPERNLREIEESKQQIDESQEGKMKADEELHTTMINVKPQTKILQEKKAKLQSKLLALKKIVHETNKDFSLAENDLNQYMSIQTAEQDKLKKLKLDQENLIKELEEKKRQHAELSAKLPRNEREIADALDKQLVLKREETISAQNIRNLRYQVEECRQIINMVRTKNAVYESIMKEKQSGRITGILGKLGDLATIDEKYDLAITSFCAALDDIVVDNEETAAKIIRHLQKTGLGTTSLIALNLLSYNDDKLGARFPEDLPRLFDLITVTDERAIPAYFHVLRHTLVADDIEQASRVGFGDDAHTVVTLQGHVVEPSGTLTGGADDPNRGRMASSVRPDSTERNLNAVIKKEEELNGEKERLRLLKIEQNALEETIAALQANLAEANETQKKLAIAINSLTKQVPAFKKSIKKQEKKAAQCKVDEGHKRKLEAAVEAARKKLETAKENAAKLEDELKPVLAEIAASSAKIKELRKQVTEHEKKFNKVLAKIPKLKAGITANVRNVKHSREKIKEIEQSLAETDNHIDINTARKNDLMLESITLQKQLDEIDETLLERAAHISNVKKIIAEKSQEEANLKQDRLTMSRRVDVLVSDISICQKKKTTLAQRLEIPDVEDPLNPRTSRPSDDTGISSEEYVQMIAN